MTKKACLLFTLLMALVSSVSFGDSLESVIEYTDASRISNIREIITSDQSGPYYLKGELYIGDSDGDDISDGIFTFARYKTTGSDGYFTPGSSYFGINVPESMIEEEPLLGRFEVELYKEGELIRAIYAERILHPYIWVYSSFEPVLLDYDTVKYKCDIYRRESMEVLDKSYHVVDLSLSNDAEIIKKVIQKSYGFNIVHSFEDSVEVDKDYYGFSGFEDHYISPDGVKYYTDIYFEQTEGIDSISFEPDEEGSVMSIGMWDEIVDGELKSINNLTINYDFTVNSYFKIYLYDESTNTRGYELNKILVIYPFKDKNLKIEGTNEMVMQSLTEQNKIELQRNHSRIIKFPDTRLEKVIREAIDKPDGDIYEADVLLLTELDASGKYIKDIEGLQYLSNLRVLDLTDNLIKDISVLSEIEPLLSLLIGMNHIEDIGSLSELSNLQYLYMNNNKIMSLESLKEITKLNYLIAFDNNIVSVSPLESLIELEFLWLDWKKIVDKDLIEGRDITLESK